jgi:xylan 1,4-beta-xylosidase
VPGAAGYVIERTGIEHTGEDGDGPKILSHGGSDVLAVPGPPFADTGLADAGIYRYRVGAVAGAEYPVWSWSAPVRSATRPGDPGPVQVRADASAVTGTLNRVWRMVGSERLSQLLLGSDEGGTERDAGKQIAAEFADALRLAHDELGATMVRAHAILHDDNAVVSRDADGALHFDFGRVDAIYDRLLGYGLRPVVELSFMPAALARDPLQTVFAYRGIISPPADWAEWRQLVTALARHLVQRYGIDEVARWAFEVWNEPNLAVFWAGTMAEYLRLYEESARAAARRRPRHGRR